MGDYGDGYPSRPGSADAASPDRAEEVVALLVRIIQDLLRGRDEFRRAYGLPGSVRSDAMEDPAGFARRLLSAGAASDARRGLQEWMAELMLHQAGLLEGYQSAAQSGTRAVLDLLDPVEIAETVRRGAVRMGPWRFAAQSGPLLQQAVWEEFLRRFRELRKMDPAEYERFSREGFRAGYEAFQQARGGREPESSGPERGEGGVS